MKQTLRGFRVFVNGKMVVEGIFRNSWSAWMTALDIYGLDKPAGSVVVKPTNRRIA